MAELAEQEMEDENLLQEEEEVIESEDQIVEEEAASEPESEEEVVEESEEEEEVITFDGESLTPSEDEENENFIQLRNANREKAKRIKELEKQMEYAAPPQRQVVSKKPTLADYEYDEEKFQEANEQYLKQELEKEYQQRQAQEEFNKTAARYQKSIESLKAKNFKEAEAHVAEVLDIDQQNLILKYAENPALAVAVIGNNKAISQELSSINDPIKFAMKLQDIQKRSGTTKKKRVAPKPTKKVGSNSGSLKGNSNKQLERLIESSTGDMNAALAARRKLRQQA